MSLFPKPELNWTEPEAFRVAEDQHAATNYRWWIRPLYLVIIVALYMLGWEFARLTPGKHPVDFVVAFPLFLALGIFLLYLLPAMLRRRPSSVSLYSRTIIKMGWQHPRDLKSFIRYRWSMEGSYFVLELINKKDRTLRLGVSDPLLRQKIDPILQRNGLTERGPHPAQPRLFEMKT